MCHNHYGYHSYYITNAWVQMYMSQLSASGSTIPWIFKTAHPHICLILKSFKLLEYQWQEKVDLIKTNKKLPGVPPQFMTMATSMTLITGMGWTVHKMIFWFYWLLNKWGRRERWHCTYFNIVTLHVAHEIVSLWLLKTFLKKKILAQSFLIA